MCGRFTLRASSGVVAEQFLLFEVAPFTARFNIAPTQAAPVIRMRPDSGGNVREWTWLRWGLVPGWAKDPGIGARLINARAETAAEKPAFRAALRRRRCLVAADGFYEWRRSGRAKEPFFVRMRDDRPFAFAGLWDVWEGPDHSVLETCTILTTSPNELTRPIHDRMPVILRPEAYAAWLDPATEDSAQLLDLLGPYPSEPMEAYRVSSLVNSPSHDTPRCIDPPL